MSHESLPEKGWGRVKEQCADCPRGESVAEEPLCLHPWRKLIALAVNSGLPVTYEHLAQAWDIGASIGVPEYGKPRRSIEVFEEEPEPVRGKITFRIN